MDMHKNYVIKVVAVGIMSLILLSVVFFMAGKIMWWMLYEGVIIDETKINTVTIQPSGLVNSFDEKVDPNKQSRITAKLGEGDFSQLANDLQGKFMERRTLDPAEKEIFKNLMLSPDIYAYTNKTKQIWQVLYFDRSLGLFVQCDIQMDQEKKWTKSITDYIGPEGSSTTPDDALGRFSGDFIKATGDFYARVFFDKEQNRFFSLDPNGIKKGPVLPPEGEHHPLEFGKIPGWHGFIKWLDWNPPLLKGDERQFQITTQGVYYIFGKTMLVLDESGRFDWLDLESLEYTGLAGYLPSWQSDKSWGRPDDFSDFAALPFTTLDGDPNGLILAVVPAGVPWWGGYSLHVFVFDKKAKVIKTGGTQIILDNLPGGLAYSIGKYLLDNLHPPILLLTSYFTAGYFSAPSAHQSLLLPLDSFMGQLGRVFISKTMREKILFSFFGLIIILPALLLGVFLAWRVARDARSLGFNRRAQKIWIITTIAFSLVGYITYRLTRPDVSLVTCPNCGKGRRSDRELCHHCQSGWLVPENIAPAWRVFDADSHQVTDRPL